LTIKSLHFSHEKNNFQPDFLPDLAAGAPPRAGAGDQSFFIKTWVAVLLDQLSGDWRP
jgi:hypothetical protein